MKKSEKLGNEPLQKSWTAAEKMKIIRTVEESELSERLVLEKLGINRSTFQRWYKKYYAEGYAGLTDKKEVKKTEKMPPVTEMKKEVKKELQKKPEVVDKAVKESMPREEVPSIPISSSTITKGTAKVTETKTQIEKEKEMAQPVAKKQKEPTPELKAETVPETEAIKESMPQEKEPRIPVSSYTITRRTQEGMEKEKAAAIEKEPTPELKAEPGPKTEEEMDSEVKKDTSGISEQTFLVIKKRAIEAKIITDKVVEIVRTRIGKSIISDMMKKTVTTSMSAIRHPVNTVSNFDKKVTKAMKNITSFDFKNNNPNSENSDNKSVVIVLKANKNITKSVKTLMNTVIK